MGNEIPDGWRAGHLTDLVTLQRGHDLPTPSRRGGEVPIMGSAGLSGYHDTARVRGPGVVVGRSGSSFGKVHWSYEDYWPLNTALFARDFCGNDPRFVYLALSTIDFEGFNSGSAQPSLNRNFIAQVKVNIPRLVEQRAIASVLGALDEKIESNRRLSHLLAEVNRLGFSSLVVPAAERGQLGDLAEVVMGQSPPGSSYSDDPGHGPLMVQGMGGFGPRHPRRGTFTSKPTKLVGPGVTLMTVRAPVGAVNVTDTDTVCGRGVAGLVSETPVFVEYLVRWLEPRWAEHETGTIFASVNRTQIRAMPIPLPSVQQIHRFELEAGPRVALINGLERERELLAALRGALLPKLISGQIRVPVSNDSAEALGAAEAHELQEAQAR